jgi:hypothetical protein
MAIAQNIINILLRNYIEYSIVDDEKIKEYLNLNDKHKFNTGYLISEQKTNQYYPNFVKNKNSDKE